MEQTKEQVLNVQDHLDALDDMLAWDPFHFTHPYLSDNPGDLERIWESPDPTHGYRLIAFIEVDRERAVVRPQWLMVEDLDGD